VRQEDTQKVKFRYVIEDKDGKSSMIMSMPLRTIVSAKTLKTFLDFGFTKPEMEEVSVSIQRFVEKRVLDQEIMESCEASTFEEMYQGLSRFAEQNASKVVIDGVAFYRVNTDEVKEFLKKEFNSKHLPLIRTLKMKGCLCTNPGRLDYKVGNDRVYCFKALKNDTSSGRKKGKSE
jgi:hypothetical protein